MTLSTVFRPQLSWAAPWGAAGSETPDTGNGDPLAGDWFWKSGFCVGGQKDENKEEFLGPRNSHSPLSNDFGPFSVHGG